jgi:Fe-S cluster assembly protein SufD
MSITSVQEPAWLQEARTRARRTFETSELPYWDRTEIRPFDPARFAPAAAPSYDLPSLPAAAARKGGILCDLATAAAEHGDLLRKHLGSLLPAERGRFEALHLASLRGGVFVYVPDGVEIEEPLTIGLNVATEGALCAPHVLVVLGEAASVSLVHRGDGGRGCMLLPSVEAVVGDAARLRFVDVQSFATDAVNYTARRGRLGRDSSLEWVLGDMGSRVVRASTESVLAGTGGQSRSLLVFFGSGNQHFDLALTMSHTGARTDANMLTKGVLKDRARSVYRGTSDIEAGSKNCNSQQSAKTLHLGGEVRSDSIPALFIDEYELSAGHAATVGKVDDEQLFYMKSRGLPEVEALRLIVEGFLNPLIERIPIAAVRQDLAALIDSKLAGGDQE